MEIKKGMTVICNVDYKIYEKECKIINIENEFAEIEIDGREYPFFVKIPINDLKLGENKNFRLKDIPEIGEEILVSNNDKAWFIRSFQNFDEDGRIVCPLQGDDRDEDMQFIDLHSTASETYWKMYKRFKVVE